MKKTKTVETIFDHTEHTKKCDNISLSLPKMAPYSQSTKYYILSASANLLGICFVLITGLSISNSDAKSYADEVCLFSSFLFLSSCLLSYLSIRKEGGHYHFESWADRCFIAGIICLFAAVCIFALTW